MSKFAPHKASNSNPRASQSTVCQKCLGTGHFTYQCKNSRPYVSRPSRTEQLEKPQVLAKLKAEGRPSVDVPEEFKSKSGTANRILDAKEKQRAKEQGPDRKRAKRSRSRSSSSGSDSSDSDSDSESDSGSSSGSGSDSDSGSSRRSSSSSRSRERDRKRRVPSRRSRSSSYDSQTSRRRGRSVSEDREEGGSSRHRR